MSGFRRLLERHTPEVEEEGGMWKGAQARIQIEENPGVVRRESASTCYRTLEDHKLALLILNSSRNLLHFVDTNLQSTLHVA